MVLKIRYREGTRERYRTIPNIASVYYTECHNKLVCKTKKHEENFELNGEVLELRLLRQENEYE